MNDENILIDTSVWIDDFQNKPSSISKKVDDILSRNDIYHSKNCYRRINLRVRFSEGSVDSSRRS